MPEIKLEHIAKIYPGQSTATISDYNLEIHDKEFIVFVGPSGSGKSTVLRMIAGLNSISRGNLYFDGQRMNDIPPKDRGIAMVFQDYALYPHLTVYENIAFPLRIAKIHSAELDQRVKQTANILGLDDFLDRKPADLSGGQRQRVAIAGAIVRGSKILLMDEPLSNLDAKLRVQARSNISDLHKKIGSTTIYVTHDQTEAMTLADRIVLIDHGNIQQVASPEDMYNYPANLFVATFIGSPEMNVFKVIYDNGTIDNGQGIKFKLPKGISKQLDAAGYDKKDIFFGIRPEDIHAEDIALQAYKEAVFTAQIELSELLGETALLHVNSQKSKNIVVKVNQRDNAKVGETITLAMNLNKAHFFDGQGNHKRII
ncbi:MAG: ABC transporter ATP-binding protein [Oenococcus sp.]|uniref:ABC transporter ATP-binding protein n=1 Tax=Oenococcus TaxID=46254 RepID=UPI0021E6F80C|nr:ABC transporter ATP-binding protein [Oenococcus kitaharae]MCV3296802.1 ABC transporter ATP-binding protein [Oenococcus kitaharae]